MSLERSIPILEHKFLAASAATDTSAGEIGGLAAAFNNVDALGDIIMSGAFAKSISAHAAASTSPAMLWAHNPAEPIGLWQSMRETQAGLEVRGRLSDVPRGRDARQLALDGALGLSIGFIAVKFSFDAAGHRLLQEADLREISIVASPANTKAKRAGLTCLDSISASLSGALRWRVIQGTAARPSRGGASGPVGNPVVMPRFFPAACL